MVSRNQSFQGISQTIILQIWKFVNQCQQNKNIKLKVSKVLNESNKNVKQILSTVSKYWSIKSIKSISRSIKITSLWNHHDTQMTSNDIYTEYYCESALSYLLYLITFLIRSFQHLLQEITAGGNAISCFSMLLLRKIRFLSTSYVWNENFIRFYFYPIKPLIFLISIRFWIKCWYCWYSIF